MVMIMNCSEEMIRDAEMLQEEEKEEQEALHSNQPKNGQASGSSTPATTAGESSSDSPAQTSSSGLGRSASPSGETWDEASRTQTTSQEDIIDRIQFKWICDDDDDHDGDDESAIEDVQSKRSSDTKPPGYRAGRWRGAYDLSEVPRASRAGSEQGSKQAQARASHFSTLKRRVYVKLSTLPAREDKPSYVQCPMVPPPPPPDSKIGQKTAYPPVKLSGGQPLQHFTTTSHQLSCLLKEMLPAEKLAALVKAPEEPAHAQNPEVHTAKPLTRAPSEPAQAQNPVPAVSAGKKSNKMSKSYGTVKQQPELAKQPEPASPGGFLGGSSAVAEAEAPALPEIEAPEQMLLLKLLNTKNDQEKSHMQFARPVKFEERFMSGLQLEDQMFMFSDAGARTRTPSPLPRYQKVLQVADCRHPVLNNLQQENVIYQPEYHVWNGGWPWLGQSNWTMGNEAVAGTAFQHVQAVPDSAFQHVQAEAAPAFQQVSYSPPAMPVSMSRPPGNWLPQY